MARAVRQHVLLAVLLATAGVAASPVPVVPDLEGMYVANGMNPDGTEYRGFVQIVKHGESFVVSWMFPAASGEVIVFEPASIGIGIVNSGMLAVSYYSARLSGVVLYRIEEDGKRLAGYWTVAGEAGIVQTETLIRLPRNPSEPVETEPPTQGAPRPPVKTWKSLTV
jgi:hypothetical protein